MTVLPPLGRTDVQIKKQEFRTFTRNLRRLRAWLQACQVTEVAMESTGQYWLPVWNILEGAIPKMLLLNPLARSEGGCPALSHDKVNYAPSLQVSVGMQEDRRHR